MTAESMLVLIVGAFITALVGGALRLAFAKLDQVLIQIVKLESALIGINGQGGLMAEMTELRHRVDRLEQAR
jgi:hypothetical protein